MQIYLHIPFCDSKCFYCSFNSYSGINEKIPNYFKALKVALREELQQIERVSTIYIGGGTPSAVPANYYQDIFELLHPLIKDNIEITVEANPNSATKSWLRDMRDFGVNRVSFGVQSFNSDKLRALNRSHSPEDAVKAIENSHLVGFKNISLDLIYDLYLDSKKLLIDDIKRAFSLPINHISTYELTIERGTEFNKRPEVKADRESYNFLIRDEITKRGFEWYEVSNYGKYRSLHNLGYWRYRDYLGVGAGAVGFIKDRRYYLERNIDSYIKNPLKKRVEVLSSEDILMEKILLGLRSIVGVDRKILPKKMREMADILVEERKLELLNGTYINKDFFLGDELALFIIQN